jgi:CBS domain containing-hemolysin-like protein
MVYHDGYRFTVVGIHGQRIAKVKVEKVNTDKSKG